MTEGLIKMLLREKLKKNNRELEDDSLKDLEVPFRVMIVDDEEEMHKVTHLFFKNFSFMGKKLEFISAYSGEEAISLAHANPDIAIILLDIVMEDDKAGLRVVEAIREEVKNDLVRIIVRTGQPGVMLPDELAEKYQINDYKLKSELTQEKLSATLTTALRAYVEISMMDEVRRELEEEVRLRTEALRELNRNLEKRIEKELSTRLRVEQEKIKQQEAMIQQSKLASMGEMMGSILHQWSQPLTSISLMANLVIELHEKKELTCDESVRLSEDVVNNVNFMAETMIDFKDFFRPNKVKSSFSVDEAIKTVQKILAPQFHKYDIKVVVESDVNLKGFGYPNEFKQAVLNIMNNAKDAIVHHNYGEGEIRITARSEMGDALVSIEDSGGGIPKEILPRIFDNYVSSKGEQGSGIGLHMTKIMIEENMGGSISASNGHSGACFLIRIPSCG